jgi:hypothetical protein
MGDTMRRIWLAIVLAGGLMGTVRPAQAASLRQFQGSTCFYRGDLWSLTQQTATAMDTFDRTMRAAYGAKNPYLGTGNAVLGASALQVSPATAKALSALDTLLTKPATGLIPRTWTVARSYGLSSPFTGTADVPTTAIRAVFALEFAFENTVKAEVKKVGAGRQQYRAAHTDLTSAWTALQAVPCVPAVVSDLQASVQNGWVVVNWNLSYPTGVASFTVTAHGQPLFQVVPSKSDPGYSYAAPYLPGPYVLTMMLASGGSKSFTFPLTSS